MWMNVPATTVNPVLPQTILRLSTIPHGDSLLAQGVFPQRGGDTRVSIPGAPDIPEISTLPTGPGTERLGYMDPDPNAAAVIPPDSGLQPSDLINPNGVLVRASANQDIVTTTKVAVSTHPFGGIVNSPFVVKNANATEFSSVFWIEKVRQADGTTFEQLQYSQTVILEFLDVRWPHTTVATLVKQ